MVADFTRTLEEEGAWAYRRLCWETGLIGQVLYLEAEAAGVRSTGMGCYFDDLVHRLLDLNPPMIRGRASITLPSAVRWTTNG
jgi:hypothetical protein